MIEIVSPGNKSSRGPLTKFVEKAVEVLEAGVHLLIVDLFPPGPHDPSGIHDAIWQQYAGKGFKPIPGKPLTLAAYVATSFNSPGEGFVEPVAVGQPLVEMPLFLDPESYVPTPLPMTYQLAWEAVPSIWQKELVR